MSCKEITHICCKCPNPPYLRQFLESEKETLRQIGFLAEI